MIEICVPPMCTCIENVLIVFFLDPPPPQLGGMTLLAMGIWVSVDRSSFLQLLGPFSTQGMHFVNVVFFCIAIGAACSSCSASSAAAPPTRRASVCCSWWVQKTHVHFGLGKISVMFLLLALQFFSVILIIFISEVAAGVVALAYSSFAEGILRAWATPALKKDYGSDPVVTKIWNTTMTELKCCGFTNYTDFVGSTFETENGGNLPPICCCTNNAPCSPVEAEIRAVQGCFKDILETLKKQANIVGGIAAGIGVLEVKERNTSSCTLTLHLCKCTSMI
ncbi:hypothetical protein L3Q82_026081 [Scortum barcoo]|uniref:Uncharacterized protein n=1 Tax=Scortum barcoo TaxID=214431 RepID=A0ACB8WMR5_9TELE|nr:hypothetical protein L3Q82_026081 [Scortum barcoo]